MATEFLSKNARKTPRVLIVDDDPGQRSLLDSFLRSQAFDTLTAASGERALEILQNEEVAMMISDVRMPGISGLETLRRARERHAVLPVLLVTAYADIRDAVAPCAMARSTTFPSPSTEKNWRRSWPRLPGARGNGDRPNPRPSLSPQFRKYGHAFDTCAAGQRLALRRPTPPRQRRAGSPPRLKEPPHRCRNT